MEAEKYNEALKKYLDSRQTEIIGNLCQFVKIESVSDNLEKVNEALEFALNLARSFGFEAKSYLNGQVGVVEIGDGSEVMGILSHVDVVGPGNMEKWKTKPFDPVVKDGKIYGRGTLDDKGPLIACLYAMKAVCELGVPLQKKVQLILGTQEEVEWADMKAYVRQFPLPDYGFTPDGEFPICNIEKGCIDLTILFPLDLSGESADDGRYLTFIEAGTATNVVPGTCNAEITEYKNGKVHTERLKTLGKAVHSCQPEKGENAIFKMIKQINTMEIKENRLLALLTMINEKLGDMYGKGLGLYSESEYYNGEFMHRNVFTPTILKIENNTAKLHVNIRTAYGSDENAIVNVFKKIAAGYGGEIVKAEILPAVYVSKNKPFLQAFAKSYEEISGRKNEFVLAYGGSYAKAMPNIVSWGPIFPGEDDTCHEENEYISIKSLMDNAKIFALAINKIVLSKESFK
jgi:succinyl-diaminopimelate desuccinylase